MSRQRWRRLFNWHSSFLSAATRRRTSKTISKHSTGSNLHNLNLISAITCSYVTRIDENSPTGATLVFPEPYITRVSDDDAGKNGVFSLTLLNNNGTFEIFPNVAERKANFIIRVRDNHMLDFEEFTSLSFQVSTAFASFLSIIVKT